MNRPSLYKVIFSVAGITSFLFVLTGPVMAQETDEQRTEGPLEEVIVTSAATRLQSGFEAPTPVTTVDREALDNRGITNVADYLNEIPAFKASITPQTTVLSSAANGANGLDLRSLGTNRTLILIDRRRHVPTNDGGSLDVNVVPQGLLKRVEVVTGGSSAQWGSDAVAGVVNLILDRDLDGMKIDLSYGASDHSDGENEFLSFAYGVGSEDGRGHITLAAEYQNNHGVLNHADRDWGRERWGLVGNPLDTGPNDGIPARIITRDVVMGLGTDGGYLPAALGNHPAVAQIQFGPGGEILPYDIGEFPIPFTFASLPFQVGGDGRPFSDDASLSAPQQRKNLMVASDYDINDKLTFFFDASYSETHSRNETVQPWNFIGGGPDVIFADNPFIPAPLQQIMSDNGVPVLVMARINTDHGYITSDTTIETARFVAGLKGEINGWDWEVYMQKGKTTLEALQFNNVLKQNRNFAVDAIRDPASGEIVCRDPAARANGCAPLNLFGHGSPSQASLDYIHGTTPLAWEVDQEVYAASISGEVFDLPAGPLALAFGLEYREESAATTTDKASENGEYFIVNVTPVAGEFDVSEAFAEVGLPVFETSNGMSLDLNAAVRYTDYSSSGQVTTWKGGLTFSPIESLTFRANASEDIRAPNIGELFAASRLFFGNVVDPWSGDQIRLTQLLLGGNVNLSEETSRMDTLGIVYQPGWLERLSVSVDWYKIDLEDAISTLPAATIVDACVDLGAFCELITLNDNGNFVNPNPSNPLASSGFLHSIQANFQNVAQRKVEGIDFEVAYNFDLGAGAVDLRWLGSYVSEQSFSPDGIDIFDDAGVVGPEAAGGNPTPNWQWNLIGDYTIGNFGVLAQIRYVGEGDYIAGLGPEDINDNSVEEIYYLNLAGRYNIPYKSGNIQIYGGVNNALDEDPPVAPVDFVNNLGTNFALYDVIGRYYYAGVRVNF